MSASVAPVFPSIVRPFQIEGSSVRGRLVRLGATYADVLGGHDYPPPVARLLGETLALSAALSTSLKYDGTFILQTSSNGPVRMLVADVTSDGGVRGYARYRKAELPEESDPDTEVPALLGSGHLAFTVDQGPDTQRYQGIVALEGETMSDVAIAYFRQSEQIETAIVLAADPGTGTGDARAAALLLQRLPKAERRDMDPEEEEESWRNAVVLMNTVTPDEMLDPNTSTNGLLYRLYHEQGVRVFDGRPLHFACRCSREKVARTLASFSPDELKDMKTDEGLIVATCEFCHSEYAFDDAQLAELRRTLS
jgi:molecular chaperone Hsp33